jgi:hypothetical protein
MGEPVRFGLVGPSYQSQSVSVDNQACINLYPEQDESGGGNAPLVLYPTPGSKTFVDLKGGPSGAPSLDGMANGGSIVPQLTFSIGPIVPTTATDWAIMATASGALAGVPSGWSAIAGADTTTWQQFLSSSAPLTGTGTFPISGTWAGAMALFKTNAAAPAIANANSNQFPHDPSGNTATNVMNPTTASNSIIVIYKVLGPVSAAVPTISDSQHNTYQLVASKYLSDDSRAIYMWVAQNIVGGPNTVIVATTDVLFGSTSTFEDFEYTNLFIPSTGPVRGELTINGRSFAICGNGFFEIFANATFFNRGVVANDALPVTMAASPQQLLIASAGMAYVFDLIANTLTPIPGATFPGPVGQAAICDDFFILTIQASKQFFVSAALNANDWVSNGSAIVSVFPDNIVGMIVIHRQIVFGSDTKIVTYFNSGNIFPFDVVPGSDMDQGLAAMSSYAPLNNTYLWLGADERGHGKVWMASGYTPQRVSNHAIEFAIQGYSRIDDAVAFVSQYQGHDFYCLYFPTPSVIWVYDTLTGMWHQESFTIATTGQFQAAHRWNHTFNFGKHLVGDWGSGKVYEMHIPVMAGTTWQFGDDDGSPIVRVRRAPHISKSQRRQYFNELQILVEAGLGPIPPLRDSAGNPRGPILSMRFSNTSGKTWNNYVDRDCGQAGEFSKRLRWLRLGEGRDRIFEVRYSDTPAIRITDAYLDYDEGVS